MSEVLDYVRERAPDLADVPDAELTLYVGDRQPDLLTADRAFQAEYNRLSLQRSKRDDLAAEAKRENRKASLAYTAEQIARGVALEPITKPLGAVTQKAGRMVTGAVQDVASAWSGGPAQYSVGENLAAATLGEPTPYEQQTAGLTYQQDFLPKALAQTSGLISDMIPKLVVAGGVGTALKAAGAAELPASMASAGLVFGSTPEGFDPVQGATMALFPGASKAGQAVVSGALSKLGVKLGQNGRQAWDLLGGLAGAQAYMEVLNTPQYLSGDLSKEEKQGLFFQGLALNLGMHLPAIPGLVKGTVDAARVRNALREAVEAAHRESATPPPPRAGEAAELVDVQTPEQAASLLARQVEPKLTLAQVTALQAEPPAVQVEVARSAGLIRTKRDFDPVLTEARERVGAEPPVPAEAQIPSPLAVAPAPAGPEAATTAVPSPVPTPAAEPSRGAPGPIETAPLSPTPDFLGRGMAEMEAARLQNKAAVAQYEAQRAAEGHPIDAIITENQPTVVPAREAARPGDASEATRAEQPTQPGVPPTVEPPPPQVKRVARGLTARGRFNRETEANGPDILSFIQDQMPLVSKGAARKRWGAEKFKLNQSLWDDAPASLSSPTHNVIYSPTGSLPDQVAQAAYEAGVLKSPSVNELWSAITAASRGRVENNRRTKREERWLQEEEKAHTDWIKATDKGAKRVNADNLRVGESMEVEGERVEVTAVDPDTGDVTLKDGRKFGTQVLREGQSIYVEKLESLDEGMDWVEPEATPAPAKPAEPAEPPPVEIRRTPPTVSDVTERLEWQEYRIRQMSQGEADAAFGTSKSGYEVRGYADKPWVVESTKVSRGEEGDQRMEWLVRAAARTRPEVLRKAALSAEPFAAASADIPAPPALPPKPKPEVKMRPLTKAEQREFEDLTVKVRAAREANGPRLTTEETQRYEYLTALAGQTDLLQAESSSANQGRIRDLRAKADQMDKLRVATQERAWQSKHRRDELLAEAKTYAVEAERARADARRIEEQLGQPEVDPWAEPAKGGGDLFASPPMVGRGGELGTEPPPPADNPRFSAFDASPMELPEAVRMVKLLTGIYPKIKEKLPGAFGNFNTGTSEIKLRADIFDLLTQEEKTALKQQADDYAKAAAEPGDTAERIAQERYEYLLERAYEEAKTRNPIQALKTAWHEIGHLLDWLPDHLISGRGNIFGRLAAVAKEFRKHTLPIDPAKPAGTPPTAAEKAKLEQEAERQLREEMGPIREIVKTIIVEEPEWKITGVTAEDITNILREGAGKETPELTRWFAEQSSQVKAEILRKAMRGLVDERLAALGTKKQVGTRTTTKTVREKVGRDPTREEIRARFQELFRQELRKRNLAQLATLKAELSGLIAWWRGVDTIPDYFKQSHEMYADAFSVLANNPAAVLKRAPLYYELFFNYLDRKPEFKRLYDQIQTQLKSGQLMGERVRNLRESWNADDARSLKVGKERLTTRGRDFLDNVLYHFDRRFGPIYRTARGTTGEGAVREAVGSYLYRATEHERYLGTLNREVGTRLVKSNLDWNDLGESLFLHRIAADPLALPRGKTDYDRMNLANPLGWTPKNALERLAELQRDLGPERWAALEQARADYRRLYEAHVVSALNEARMFTPELMQVINARADYATFAAVRNLPDTGIQRMLETAYGSSVTPHIYRSVGNLGEIKNPATATVLKGLSLLSAAYRNTMKREVVALLQANDPANIMPAKRRWNGKALEHVLLDNHPTVGTIVYLVDGKPQAFYTRKVVADAVNAGNPTENVLYSALIRATGWQKGLFTQLNYAFWPVNMVRDALGWQMQVPGASPLAYARVLGPAIRAARDSVTHRRSNSAADGALRRKMLISRGDPRGVWAAADNEFEMKLASFGVDPAQWSKQADKVHGLVKAWNYYRELGQTVERVNKIAGMLHLDAKYPDMPEWKKREIVRERAGSPNFLERGASNPAVDLMFLFYNPWKEGVRSLAKSARENPWSFAAKATVAVALPTILQAAAVNGWLGEDRRKQYRSVTDYDLTNYLVVPLGWSDESQGKVVYLRLPLWEPARVAHGLLFQTLTSRGKGILSHAGGQVPGINPIWKVGLMWGEYLQGKNPVDITRAVNVLTETQQDARGPQGDFWSPSALTQMLKQTWNEAGGSIITRFRNLNLESPPETDGEQLLALPVINNALGRWVKVSDRGIFEQDQREVTGPIEQQRAQIRLAVQPIIEKLSKGEGVEALTDSERRILWDPYALSYLLDRLPPVVAGQRNLLMRRLDKVGTREGKAALLQSERR